MRQIVSALLVFVFRAGAQTPGSVAADTLTMDQAVQESIAHNLDMAAARYGVSIAEAKGITASLRPNPVVSASADHQDLLGTGYDTINNGGPREFSVRTDFVLERGGKRAARMELAAAEKTLAQLNFEDALRRLIFDVTTAFVDVQQAKENLILAGDNLRSLSGVVEVNAARVQSGDLAVVELNRSRVAAAQFQTAVRQAELQLAQAKNRLKLLLGRNSGAIDVTGAMRREPGPADLNRIRELALKQRPDLGGLRQLQARNQADLRLQLAQGKIDWTAGTEYRRQQAPSSSGNSLGFFVSAPLPIFNKNQGEIARSQQEIAQAGALAKALEARIAGEAAAVWEQYTSAGQLLAEMEKDLLARARDVRSAMEYSYRRGEASLVEFLDAQRAFNDATQSYNSARADYARSLYLIDAVMAGAAGGRP